MITRLGAGDPPEIARFNDFHSSGSNQSRSCMFQQSHDTLSLKRKNEDILRIRLYLIAETDFNDIKIIGSDYGAGKFFLCIGDMCLGIRVS